MIHSRILQHELGLARSIIPEFVFKKLINTNEGNGFDWMADASAKRLQLNNQSGPATV